MRTISLNNIGDTLVQRMIQFMLGRILFGGIYVKMQGEWHSCHVILVLSDGERVFRRDDPDGGSFCASVAGIEAFEEHA